jgi:hypothetical protein
MVVEIKVKQKTGVFAEVIGRTFVYVAVGLIAIRLEDYLILTHLDRAITTIVGILFGFWVVLPLYKELYYINRRKANEN